MMRCRQATRLMSESQDRRLTFTEKASLQFHTSMCSACRNALKQMRVIHGAIKAYSDADDGAANR